MHTLVRLSMCRCVRVCALKCVYVYLFVYGCMHAYLRVCELVQRFVYAHVCVCAHKHMLMQADQHLVGHEAHLGMLLKSAGHGGNLMLLYNVTQSLKMRSCLGMFSAEFLWTIRKSMQPLASLHSYPMPNQYAAPIRVLVSP